MNFTVWQNLYVYFMSNTWNNNITITNYTLQLTGQIATTVGSITHTLCIKIGQVKSQTGTSFY